MSSCNNPCQNPRGNSGRREQYNREMMQRDRMQMERRSGEMDGNRMRNISLAMAYVPWQKWGNLYQADEGFHSGTIFRELDMPFTGKGMC